VRAPEISLSGKRLIWSPEIDLTPQVGLFARAGVVSFKIEGRTRSADYVAQSTRQMRAAVDSLLSDATYQDPEMTTYFYLGHHSLLREEG
jgi:collagenase-like PrtC family protease